MDTEQVPADHSSDAVASLRELGADRSVSVEVQSALVHPGRGADVAPHDGIDYRRDCEPLPS